MANESLTPSLISTRQYATLIRENIARVIIGKSEIVDLLLVALLSNGHVLLEDVPGTGKTVLAKSLARSLNATFQRIQGTPDMLPSDIIGVSYFDQKLNEFTFRAGPIFSHILLVDEINRTTPRTQAALLEAMAERQVTVERESRRLPQPFLVIATQNPIELEGTFPLPEAQLDRFFMRVQMGYPTEEEEQAILHRFKREEPLDALQAVVSGEEFLALQQAIRQVQWQPAVERYLLMLVRGTREYKDILLGVSPRGTLALSRACEAYAAIQGRDFVLPDDVKYLAPFVLSHRLLTTHRNRMRGKRSAEIITEIIQKTPVPTEDISSVPTSR
ncbi:AAA family ATPase [Ktedonospora formicarum]|uniref:ATPase n=1 Tax=Ktedonospora formicarum TaxID=2778364 RepID=A0A8J3MTR8_9CHLR|nr:MoxR family ATPase [Ktedonospora formicarum]GHO45883.1 ATPase [Ktedonospora formicarum]